MQVKAYYNEKENKITLEITHDKKTETIDCSVKGSGLFKFKYKHPELKEPDTYQGAFLTKTKFMIYPILGKGVISDQPIEIEK